MIEANHSQHRPFRCLNITHLCLAGWVLHLLLGPFHVWQSGLPQPADLIMVLGLGLFAAAALSGAIGRDDFDNRLRPALAALLVFVSYTLIVSLFWTLITGDPGVLRYPLFYLFDYLVFVLAVYLYTSLGRRFLKVTLYAVALSVLIQALISFWMLDVAAFRQALFFNNPNQLGYFALLSATIILLGTRHFRIPVYQDALIVAAVSWLVMISLSSAAMLAMVMLFMLAVLRRPGVVVLAVFVCVLAYVTFDLQWAIDNVSSRIGRIGVSADESLAGRGYDRLMNHPEHLIFGAGEGAFYRFRSALRNSEIHSTVGTVLFSYGIVGSGLAVWFLVRLAPAMGRVGLTLLIPSLFYGLTHHGLRDTLFWILLAFTALIEVGGRDKPNASRSSDAFAREPGPSGRLEPGVNDQST